ncbi:META domain-containing protein [Psychroflexus sp. YR1-1]|uniref:META domain-containing protein n=1 Tax=Psychroflexus aurantiacus TaxID=2709310 RepID=A0A6B3QY82_9FLAO|nr:META domain-containing protein [Psychroflexus aurantiacus]NEV92618.1 META domain-containing protein [Psychroflexus aurantiacus]
MRPMFHTKLGIMVLSIGMMLGSCKAQKMTSDQLLAQDYKITQMGDRQVSESELSLSVNPENSTVSGFAGCNQYTYTYKLKDGNFDLGFARATKMYCDDAMKLENLFFKTMASVTSFENSKEAIHLKDKNGEIVIKAKKKNESE